MTDSCLPALTRTTIHVPQCTRTSLPPRRCMTAHVPARTKPTTLSTSSANFTSLPTGQRNALERKIDDMLKHPQARSADFSSDQATMSVLKEKKRKAMLKGNYDDSERLENIIQRLNYINVQAKFEQSHNQKMGTIDQQIDQAKFDIKAAADKWNKKIEQFNHSQQVAAKNLEQEQAGRLSAYDSRIPSDLPSKYCKLSAKLLNMREQEKALVLSKRFEEAKSLKKTCDRLEKEEIENQKQKFMQIKQKERQQLIDHQNNAVRCFTEKWTRQSEAMNQEMRAEISKLQRGLDNLLEKKRLQQRNA